MKKLAFIIALTLSASMTLSNAYASSGQLSQATANTGTARQ